MKFAKQLEDNLVPEWRVKYIDYKGAKKKLKAVRKAIRNAEAASSTAFSDPSTHAVTGITKRFRSGSTSKSATSSLLLQQQQQQQHAATTASGLTPESGKVSGGSNPVVPSPRPTTITPGKRKYLDHDLGSIGENADEDEFDRRNSAVRRGALTDADSRKSKLDRGDEGERQYLNPSPSGGDLAPPSTGYGSISPSQIPARPATTIAVPPRPTLPPDLDLPGPARPLEGGSPVLQRAHTYDSSLSAHGSVRSKTDRTPRFALATTTTETSYQNARPTDDYGLKPPPSADRHSAHPIFKNVFNSLRHKMSPVPKASDPNLRNAVLYLEMTEDAQKEFFAFLQKELHKIDEFYESKELEAKERLVRIEHQISIMTKNRLQEKERERLAKEEDATAPGFDWKHPKDIVTGTVAHMKKKMSLDKDDNGKSANGDGKIRPTIAKLGSAAMDAATGAAQPNSRETMHSSLDDYSRRAQTQHVRYKTAKRKLKTALVEYYHSLELLKSYSLLNREGFRKILKKFDKTAHTRISNKYLEEKVNMAGFASSDEVDTLLAKTEDIFATHYEKGRRKHAIERLRTRENKRPATAAMFRSGIYIGMAIPLGIQAIYEAWSRSEDGYGMRHESEVSYLLQIWAGFGFPTIFMLLFCICCRAWVEARINYVFIFEFDTRNNLDWRQLLELPSLFAFIQIVLMWFSFAEFWGTGFDRIWFPLIYVIILILILFNPFKFGYYHTRKWLLYTCYRLFWAGFYPVEFRDFWSGDIFCSMTYTIGNIPLFFCLWSRVWDSPNQCNSSNSRLLGFFTTLPSIWRLLQCFRRYRDTNNWFPHMANAAKYSCGIFYYMMLSMWRMDKGNEQIKAAFILFAALNASYTSVWDLLMDWSLLNWYAPNRLLRTELAYRRPVVYYLAMFIDVPIRFSWIFYLIFQNDVQHSALLSFLLSLAELFRRFVWCFFRMENEHCTNVNKFRAYKDDVPLPYNIPCPTIPSRSATILERPITTTPTAIAPATPISGLRTTGTEARVDEEIATAMTPTVPGGRTRAELPPDRTPLLRAYTIATRAHAQDFERKRPPTSGSSAAPGGAVVGSAPSAFRRVFPGNPNAEGAYGYDDEDDDDSDDDYEIGRMEEHGSGGLGYRRESFVDDVVEGMAGLRRRNLRYAHTPEVLNGGQGVGGGEGVMYAGTGAVLSPDLPPQGQSPGEGTSSGFTARDYARRSK